jgi:hypothetical protein
MRRFRERIETLLSREDYPPEERDRLIRLMLLFVELPAPPDPDGDFPKYGEYREKFLACAAGGDGEALEEAFLNLYAHLHMHEAEYTEEERRRMDEAGGYWAHAGGLSPILKAAPWIHPGTVSTDLGAGNGLQGFLFQLLYPHRKTVQIEISSRMVEVGKRCVRAGARRDGFHLSLPTGAPIDRQGEGLLRKPGRAIGQRPWAGGHLQHRRLPEGVPVSKVRDLLR